MGKNEGGEVPRKPASVPEAFTCLSWGQTLSSLDFPCGTMWHWPDPQSLSQTFKIG